MKIALSSESTIDLSKELLEKYKINILPFSVILGEESKYDGTFSTQEIFDFVKDTKVLPKTSAVNCIEYENHFKKLLETNDAVIHIGLSSGISCAISNAIEVASQMKNVYIIDSKSLSTGIALLTLYAAKLIEQGLLPEEIVKKVNERIPYVQTSFVIERLDYLYKGGRCSSLQLLGANILKIRPQIIMADGKMSIGKKFRGTMDAVVKDYCLATLEKYSNPDKEIVFLTYSSATESMLETAKKILVEYGFKNIYLTQAGCTITSHCGEHTLGILYMNDGTKN